jgi:hypothetical protein
VRHIAVSPDPTGMDAEAKHEARHVRALSFLALATFLP